MEFLEMSRKLYVGNLSYKETSESLEDLFSVVGKVTRARVITDKITGKSKGFGFVEMETDALAEDAIKSLNEKDFGGRRLKVSEAREQIRAQRNEPMVNYQ